MMVMMMMMMMMMMMITFLTDAKEVSIADMWAFEI